MTPTNKLTAQGLNISWQDCFQEIQCYQDDDVNIAIHRLLNDPVFIKVIHQLFSTSEQAQLNLKSLENIDTVEELQAWVETYIFPRIAQTYEQLTVSGLAELDASETYIFISNHRDIVMDPLLLNRTLRSNGFTTANCAIGDNLLQHPSANDLALLNRCFKVFRSIKSPRAIFKAMKIQSAYIQYLLFAKKENVWIAQKEGRAKDGIDLTNPALIKMLSLAKPKEIELADYLSNLNIVPVSFSYEWDPCAIDKARELATQKENSDYTKDKLDDFIATKKGIEGNKGHIHIHFGDVITQQNNEVFDHKCIAKKIDASIHSHYKLYPVNYAAFTATNQKAVSSNTLPATYSKQEINTAKKQLERQLEGESAEIKSGVYKAYAQVINHRQD